MNMLAQFEPNQKTMSSREIAQLCEKEHRNVKRDAEIMFKGLKLDALNFEHIYFDSMNRQQTEYLLDEELSMTLVTGYNIVLRNRVIKRWKELEQSLDLNNPMQLRNLLLGYAEKNIQLQQQVAILEPKATALDQIADTSSSFCIRDAAKTVGVSEKKFIQFLLDQNWVYRSKDGRNTLCAYSKRLAQKVMSEKVTRVIETSKGPEVFTQARITSKGLTRLAAMVRQAGLVEGVAA